MNCSVLYRKEIVILNLFIYLFICLFVHPSIYLSVFVEQEMKGV